MRKTTNVMSTWKGKQSYDLKRGISEQKVVMPAFADKHGYEWTDSSFVQDTKGKFDGVLTAHGNSYRIQYKGVIKGSPRGTLLFEYNNVAGNRGWGRGDCDFIFQRISEVRAVTYNRLRTLDMIHETVGVPGDFDRRNGGTKPVMEWTGRPGRKDAFIYIPVDLLIRHCQGYWRDI